MTVAVFPTLAGQGITVLKRPKMDVRVAAHASGREARAPNFSLPVWELELTFDGLGVGSAYPGLGSASVETLAGFFAQMQGPLIPFFYRDPTDSVAVNRWIGIGDGSTLTFVLTHAIGGLVQPIDAVLTVSSVTVNGVPFAAGSQWSVSGANTISFSNLYTPAAGAVIAASYTYGYYVRFSDDVLDLEEFMSLLILCKTVKLQTVRERPKSWGGQLITIAFQLSGSWTVPVGVTSIVKMEAYGGGAGGQQGWSGASGFHTVDQNGGGGGGGGYAAATGVAVTPGAVLTIIVGQGGTGATGPSTAAINGGDSSVTLPGQTVGISTSQIYAQGGGNAAAYYVNWHAGGSTAGGSPGGVGGQSDWRTETAYGGLGGGGSGGPAGLGAGAASYPYPYLITSAGGGGGGSGGANAPAGGFGGAASGIGAGQAPPAGSGAGSGGASAYNGGAGGSGGAYLGAAAGSGSSGTGTTAVSGLVCGPGGGGGGGAQGQPGGAGGAFGGGGGGGGTGSGTVGYPGGNGGAGVVLLTYPYVYS